MTTAKSTVLKMSRGLKETALVLNTNIQSNLQDYNDLNDWESSQTLWLLKHAKIKVHTNKGNFY